MRAAMYYANDDVRIVELPTPRIGPGEILVRVKASGICGSDVMEWYRKPKAPLVLGHEIAAEVVQVGAGVDSVKVGDRVVEFRKAGGRKAGADFVIDGREDVPARAREANGGDPADLVVTCTGAPKAIAQGLASVDRGGTVLFFAPIDPMAKVNIPFNELWREEITLTSSYGGSPRDIRESVNLLREKRLIVTDLITHVLPLGKAAEGFRLVAEAHDSIKVVLRP